MLPSQLAYLEGMKRGRTAQDKKAATEVDKASHAALNRLRALPENSMCFDCDAPKPGWAVLPHGIFVCIDCAQLHRNLGRHISQTKAINTGTYLWLPDEIAVMKEVGNGVASRAFASCALPAKPTRDSASVEKLEYVQQKYVSAVPKWADALDAHVRSGLRDANARPLAQSQSMKPSWPREQERQAETLLETPPDLISFDQEAPVTVLASSKHDDFFAQFGL